MKRLISLLLALFLSVFAFAAAAGETLPSCTASVLKDEEFGAVMIGLTIDEFNATGFQYGDSCDLTFSNGRLLEDVPYYNGYYARTNEYLIVAYPGYPHPAAAIQNGPSLWKEIGCAEGDTVTVTLREAGKYLAVQESLNTVYSNDRADYPDDGTFANFRAMNGGKLRKDTFYRGASPVNDSYLRAGTADRLIGEKGIRFILDLADTKEKAEQYAAESRVKNFPALEEAGKAATLGLSASYRSEDFREKLAGGLREMMEHEGPYYIHCLEGKDRTGLVCLLLEALSGADETELEADYMETYRNYYGIIPGSDRYDAVRDVKFRDIYDWMSGLGNGTPEDGAAEYLYGSGMTRDEVEQLKRFLTE